MLARFGFWALAAYTAFAQNPRLTNATIVEMTGAGAAPEAIVQKIVSSPAPGFNLDSDSLSFLLSRGINEGVIRAMAARQTGRRVPVITAASGSLPTKVGVYLHSPQGLWVELEQEGVHWQKPNVLIDVFNLGSAKVDGDATVDGKISPNSPLTKELLVVAPEGVSLTEYQLLNLREHGNSRQFRETPAHASLGYTQRKLAPSTYLVNLSDNLQPGEYALLPPGPFASRTVVAGKIYSFRIAAKN
jgi:hypothetical protein